MSNENVHFLYIREQLASMNKKLDTVNEQAIKTEEASKSAHKRLDTHEEVLETHKTALNRGYGILAGIGLVTGGIGAAISKVFG